MATPERTERRAFRGAPPIVDHEHALASVQAGSRRLDFLRRWDGDGAALGAATMLCRAQADFPTREPRCQSTGK
jgi:hypothetical protein